ncbi:glycosyltransferase [Patescibacteria group bacterium]|nr:glycosyltransferase [Patescibacteria group bacterium]
MRVLMLGRLKLLEGSGGDRIQILNTAKELRNLGIEVDVKDSFKFDPTDYDLVHIFQLDWTPECNIYSRTVKKAGKPIVFSPIHHNISELKRFDDEYAFDFRRISKILFRNQYHRDTFKDFYRMLFDWSRVRPVMRSILNGLKSMHIETLRNADIILVQTALEAADLKDNFGVDIKWEIVPNGVGENFLKNNGYNNPFDFSDYLICVGRIEPRKNQLKIIKAVKRLRNEGGVSPDLVLIGKKNWLKHLEYTSYFDVELKRNKWIKHIESVPYEKIPSYYHYSKVGVSASWFETTGLTSLEALYCGANAVASGKRAMEYLGKLASYCDPGDDESIYQAIKNEYHSPRPAVGNEMKNLYTWKNAAEKTLNVYRRLLNHD